MIYAIGLPGAKMRMWYETKNPAHADAQRMDGEVSVEIPDKQDYVIAESGSSFKLYTPEIEVVRGLADQQLQAQRFELLVGTYEVAGIGPFRLDEASRLDLACAAVTALACQLDYESNWRLADKTQVVLTGAQLVKAHVELTRHVAAVHESIRVARARLARVKTSAEIAKIALT